jgi:hypothetical protein
VFWELKEFLGRWVEDAVSSLTGLFWWHHQLFIVFLLWGMLLSEQIQFVSFSSQHIVACHFSQLIYFATLQLPDDMEPPSTLVEFLYAICHSVFTLIRRKKLEDVSCKWKLDAVFAYKTN